ncbi:uncharacterized protein LOC129303248 [Prosopis cineraria]|uniref:uncharacterized protein LOC129303248 n=1 Tax=Prosopis cineraria TaxID=364024 RepID=UPI00240FF4B1|nr:uncharacterized protein LOC129303248 [Prosopis cineraria]
MEGSVIKTIGLGVISWTIKFLTARRIFSNYSFEFSKRVVSTVHAILAVTLASLCVQDWTCPLCPVPSTSHAQIQTLAVTLSYLLYDMVCCFFGERISLDSTFHHFACVAGIVAGFYYQECISEMVMAFWLGEMSSPFLHLRAFLKELGYRDTAGNLAADILFAATYTVARTVAAYVAYVTLSTDQPPIFKVMGWGLVGVSAFRFLKIVRIVKYKLKERAAKHGRKAREESGGV